jgi:hypothetical protein
MAMMRAPNEEMPQEASVANGGNPQIGISNIFGIISDSKHND